MVNYISWGANKIGKSICDYCEKEKPTVLTNFAQRNGDSPYPQSLWLCSDCIDKISAYADNGR